MREVLIAGGGLAGAAAACVLARAGRDVLLVERQPAASDKVCGEFISGEAAPTLAAIGIDLAALSAQPIASVRFVHGERSVAVRLPFAGYGLSRRVLDEALLQRAALLGAEIRRGETVRLRDAATLRFDLSAVPLCARTLFLATGKHDMRGLRRMARAPDSVGFKLHLELPPGQLQALEGHVELILLAEGYAGLQRVEGGVANLCLVVSRRRLAGAGGTWDGLREDLLRTEPHLQTRLAGAVAVSPPASISGIPYGFVYRPAPDAPPRVYRLGDQMAVIPSFTGDGMAMALHSAMAATASFLEGADAGFYHRRCEGALRRQVARAMLFNRVIGTGAGRAGLLRGAALLPAAVRAAARLTRVNARPV